MENLTIRRAKPSDTKGIVDLRLLGQEHSERSNPSIWRMTKGGKRLLKEKVQNDLADDNIRILLAETDGQILGYVQGEVATRSDFAPRTVGFVSFIYVLEQFRREGIGRRLMKELCEFFDSNKAEYLTLRHIIGNKEADGFWRKLGFESIITTDTIFLKDLNLKLKVIALCER